MPTFKYTGEEARYYPQLGLEATTGTVAELDECPADGRWESAPGTSIAQVPTTTDDE